jgi:hypothetical protein
MIAFTYIIPIIIHEYSTTFDASTAQSPKCKLISDEAVLKGATDAVIYQYCEADSICSYRFICPFL